MFIRVKYVLQFSRRDDLQTRASKTILPDPAIGNRRIVWTFTFEAAGSKARKEAFHTTTDFTLLHVANLNSK